MEQPFTLTVGPGDGPVRGADDRVLQAGVDYLAALGGGTLRLSPGEWRLGNAVHLRSGIRLEGGGPETVLVKSPSVRTRLAADSDWYEQVIELEDASGFEVGGGVVLQARNPHNQGRSTQKRTLIARDGRRFRLDRQLEENFWVDCEAEAATLFPLLTGNHVHGIEISGLTLDGNREENERLDGNYAGCIFLQNCRDVRIREVTAQNFHGDGISWQICHDVLVEGCRCVGNSDLGLHPGSGSQRPVIRGNLLEENGIGLFFCWGVKQGIAEENRIVASRSFGISIGHRDTDNRIVKNRIEQSGQVGILFRNEPHEARCAHRNLLEENVVTDSGAAGATEGSGPIGYAVDIQGHTRDIVLRGNEFRDTRGPAGRVAVRLAAETANILLDANRFHGFETELLRL
jgi:hypothetical protein